MSEVRGRAAGLNISFPVPGSNNSSQGFRDNTRVTQEALFKASDEISKIQATNFQFTGDGAGSTNNIGTAVTQPNGDSKLAVELTLASVRSGEAVVNSDVKDFQLTIDTKGRITNATLVNHTIDYKSGHATGQAITPINDTLGTGSGTFNIPTLTFDSRGRLTATSVKAISYGLRDHTLTSGALLVGSSGNLSREMLPPGSGSYNLVANGTILSWQPINTAGITGLINQTLTSGSLLVGNSANQSIELTPPSSGSYNLVANGSVLAWQAVVSDTTRLAKYATGDTYGQYENAAIFSAVANETPETTRLRPQVLGGEDPFSVYPDRDGVTMYGSMTLPPARLMFGPATFTATRIYPTTPLTAAQRALLRVRMVIDTSASRTDKYSGWITGWAPDGSWIEVTKWTRFGHGEANQVPGPGSTAVLNPQTKGWVGNWNLFVYENSYGQDGTLFEGGILNYKAHGDANDPSTPQIWGWDIPNLGTKDAAVGYNLRGFTGGFHTGYRVDSAKWAGYHVSHAGSSQPINGFLSTQTTGAPFAFDPGKTGSTKWRIDPSGDVVVGDIVNANGILVKQGDGNITVGLVAAGKDPNINVTLNPKGAGSVIVGGKLLVTDLPQFSDKAAAVAGGLGASQFYRTADGTVKSVGGSDHNRISYPSDYGAIGDGVVDDTAALQAWLNESMGRAELRGRYRINSVLVIPRNVQLIGTLRGGENYATQSLPLGNDHSTLILGTGGSVGLQEHGTLERVQILSPYVTTPPANDADYTARVGNWTGTAVTINGQDCAVLDNAIIGFSKAISSLGWERWLIRGNKIDCKNGIEVATTHDTGRILDNHLWQFWSAHRGLTPVVQLEPYRTGIYMHGDADACIIRGNTIYGFNLACLLDGIYACVIEGNAFDSYYPVQSTLHQIGLRLTGSVRACRIVGNHADSSDINYDFSHVAGQAANIITANTSGQSQLAHVRMGAGNGILSDFVAGGGHTYDLLFNPGCGKWIVDNVMLHDSASPTLISAQSADKPNISMGRVVTQNVASAFVVSDWN